MSDEPVFQRPFADGRLALRLSSDAPGFPFADFAEALAEVTSGAIVARLGALGVDQEYWDIRIGDQVLTLHREHYLGVFLCATDARSEELLRSLAPVVTYTLRGLRGTSPPQPLEGGPPLADSPAAGRGLSFRLLGTPVTVRSSFFVMAVVLGLASRDVTGLLVWVAVVFVAVLLHEMGHALAARAFRQRPHIELHAMGGLTHEALSDEMPWHQRVIVSLAGPGSGFLIGGLLLLADTVVRYREPPLLALARFHFLWVTLAWGVFNLLPLLPLDGGLALWALLEPRLGAERGLRVTRAVSLATGIAGVVAALALRQPWAGLLCGVFAYDNLQRLRGRPGAALP